MRKVWMTIGMIVVVLLVAVLFGGCATPKSGVSLGPKETVSDGLAANTTRADEAAQAAGTVPGDSLRVLGSGDKARIVKASPGPVDAFALDSLGIGMGLSNTVRMTKGDFKFTITDDPGGGKSATISGLTFDEFSTSPPETITALAAFQREFNTAKIAENEAIKEAWNKAVEEWASTVRETLPALASEILKTFVVP